MGHSIFRIVDFLIGISSFFAFLAGALLIIFAKEYFKLANHLLGALFLTIAYCTITSTLLTTGYIVYVPFLYKIAFPFNYLIFPLAYIYVRVLISNQNKFRITDWLHGIPFIVTIIDYMPFYLMPIHEKRAIVEQFINDNSTNYLETHGIIPIQYHFIFRTIQGAFYCFLIVRNLYRRSHLEKSNMNPFPDQVKKVKTWINTFSFWIIFSYVSLYASVVLTEIDNHMVHLLTPIAITSLLTGIAILGLCFFIFLHPNVLYGIPDATSLLNRLKTLDLNAESNSDKNTHSELIDLNWESFNQTIVKDGLFKKPSITTKEFARAYGFSARDFSFIVRNFKQMGVPNFINELKIDYVIEQFQKGDFKQKTLEAIGREAGFGSKPSFYSSFKKIKGCTPKEYLRQNKLQ